MNANAADDARTPYTLARLDHAIRQVAGAYIDVKDISLITIMHVVAGKAWAEGRPEDEHSAVLRQALRDLNSKGHMVLSSEHGAT